MKLADIETFVVGNPPPHFGGRYFVFVKLTTDDGISGIGEAYCVPFSPHLVAKMIEDVFARYAAGIDPHNIEALWRRVYSSAFTQHPDLSLMGVLFWFGWIMAERVKFQEMAGLEVSISWGYAALPIGAAFAVLGALGQFLDRKAEELEMAV